MFCDSGAVLLETLIVLPLYLVLIGGIMWIGDLSLAKQQGLIADRYGAWNRGNMHLGDHGSFSSDVQDRFFPESAHPHQKSLLFPAAPIKWVRWWDASYAKVFIRVRMPKWTKGWLATTSQVYLDGAVQTMLGVQGRDVSGAKHHLVIMRTYKSFQENYPRNWDGKSLGGILAPWSWLVYKEPWPMDMRMMMPVTSMAGEEYTRYGPYVAISD
jgi:hypothetical protein